MQIRKRPFLLLEVLIAIILVTLSLFPLVTPYLWMIRGEKQYRSKVEMEHLSNVIYAGVIEKLYKTEIPWELIQSEESTPFLLEEAAYLASFHFENEKDKGNEETGEGVYLKVLHINIWPSTTTREETTKKKTLYSFSPKVCIARMLAKESGENADAT